mgnify:CR=1 FL=1
MLSLNGKGLARERSKPPTLGTREIQGLGTSQIQGLGTREITILYIHVVSTNACCVPVVFFSARPFAKPHPPAVTDPGLARLRSKPPRGGAT